MASSKPCISTFGLHRQEILALKNEWSALSDSAHHREGLQVLSALLQRNEKFYFSNTHFNLSDHPVKILPYPNDQPIPTTADAIHDILTIQAGNPVNCMNLYDGVSTASASISGSEMVEIMFGYLANKTDENLQKVVLPLSTPISKAKCGLTDTGLGKVDVNTLVPSNFRSIGRIFVPDSKEGWTARFLIPPAFSAMVHEHYICGQVRAHLFGRNIWLFCPPDEVHLKLWYSNQRNERGVEKTMEFVKRAKGLLVWVSLEPCVMVIPPHCFRAVLTLTPTCDIGVRAGSDIWEEEMKTVVRMMENEGTKTSVKWSDEYWLDWFGGVMKDFGVWVSWSEEIKREPSEKEKELMNILAPLMRILKGILSYH